VDPALVSANFAGVDLNGIRARYAGAGGGGGYALAWAQDDQGHPVALSQIGYVRLDVLAGHVEIDGLAVAAPGPQLGPVTYQEDFTENPLRRGWQVFGEASLFHWNPTNHNLDITWDSSRSNSYFWLPLHTVLAKDNDFQLQFDLLLEDIAAGGSPGKPFTFELAMGFINRQQAASPNFRRGTGTQSPNLVEFDYFADTGYGATVWPAFVDTNSVFNYGGAEDFTVLELPRGVWLRVAMDYSAGNQTLVTTIKQGGQPLTEFAPVRLVSSFTDYRVDAFALCNYSDAGAGGSVRAHGLVDNIIITVPAPPLSSWTGAWINGIWQTDGIARAGWRYTLERTTDFQAWTETGSHLVDGGNRLMIADTNTPAAGAFYRLRADRP
jgi:hypothetical protein